MNNVFVFHVLKFKNDLILLNDYIIKWTKYGLKIFVGIYFHVAPPPASALASQFENHWYSDIYIYN